MYVPFWETRIESLLTILLSGAVHVNVALVKPAELVAEMLMVSPSPWHNVAPAGEKSPRLRSPNGQQLIAGTNTTLSP